MNHFLYLYLFLLLSVKVWAQPQAALPWEPVQIHYSTVKHGIPNTIYDIHKDRKGYIWMGTDKGLLRYNGTGFKLYTIAEGLPDNEIFKILEDHWGRLWLCAYSPHLTYIKNNTIYNSSNSAFLRQINQKSENKTYLWPPVLNQDSSILFSHESNDTIIEIKGNRVHFIPSPDYRFAYQEPLFAFIKYNDTTYGMITSKGILHFDRSGKTLRHQALAIDQYGMNQHVNESIYLINGKLLNAHFDTIATFKYKRPPEEHTHFMPSYINGKLRIAIPSGLYEINGRTSFRSLKPTAAIEGTLKDSWVGTMGSGIYNQLEEVFSRPQKFTLNTRYYMFPDYMLTIPKTIKMGKHNYILAKYKVDLQIDNQPEIAFNDSTNKIISVTCDHEQEQLLVCGFKYAYRIKNNQATKIRATQDFKRIIALADGYMAIDTKALFYLNEDFIVAASWSRSNISNLLNINDSLFLIVNRNYMELLTLRDRELITKGIFKSSFITEPLLGASLKANELYVQTEHTAYKFLWNGVTAYPIRLAVDWLRINKKAFTAQNISLPHSKHYLVDLSLSHVDHIYGDCQYEYRFCTDDEQAEWVTASKEQISLLLNNPGDYTLMIRARSSNNTLSNTITYHFSIPMPFWRHSLFLVGVTAIVSGAVFYAFYRIQKKQKERQLWHKELELRFFQSELRSLNALMNPHFTFNALNSIQFLINDRQNELAQKYLSTFAGLLRRNLHNLESECISLEDELELIKGYLKLEQMRMKHNFHYSIYIEPDIKLSGIRIPPLLIQPLIENAVIHGVAQYTNKEGIIKIAITSNENRCCISVMDNGAETPELNLQKSFGLKNIIQRIEQINSRYNKRYKLSVTPRYPDDQITWTRLDIILEG